MDATLVTVPGTSISMNVYDDKNRCLSCRSTPSRLSLRALDPKTLSPLCVRSRGDGAAWRLLTTPTANPTWIAAEPDDSRPVENARPLPIGQTVTAPLDMRDSDNYVVKDAGIFDIAFRTSSDAQLCLQIGRKAGQDVRECFPGPSASVGPFMGGPETLINVNQRGKTRGEYELTVTPSQDKTRTHLLEPNRAANWQDVRSGAFRVQGRFNAQGDSDSFAFDTGEEAQMWRFVVLGESVRQLQLKTAVENLADIRRRPGDGRRLDVSDLYLEAGLVNISVTGAVGPYKIIAKPLGPPRADAEREPNNDLPRRLTFAEPVTGTLPTGDRDRFSLFLHRDADLLFTVEAPPGASYQASLSANGKASTPELSRVQIKPGGWQMRSRVPAGEHIFALQPRTPSPAEYRLTVNYADPFSAPESGTLALATRGDVPVLQAFSVFNQTLALPLTITNEGSAALSGTLNIWAARLGVLAAPVAVSVPPGETVEAEVMVQVPPDLYTGRLRAAAGFIGTAGQAKASLMLDLAVAPEALPLAPAPALPTPPSLLGGINVALTPLGACWLPTAGIEIDDEGDYARGNPANADNLFLAIDGHTVQGQPPVSHEALLSRSSETILAPVLDLPGDAPTPVAGIGLDTRSYGPSGIRSFAVDISLDGQSWQEVLRATHELWGQTAYYTLPDGPTPARQVRLRALDKRGDKRSIISFNSFEVIAAPGASGLTDINIADQRLGALTTAVEDMRARRRLFLDTQAKDPPQLPAKTNPTALNAAITFRNSMAADVAGVVLAYPTTDKFANYPFPTDAIVYASPAGPTGPWREVARDTLPPEPAAGSRHRIDFPEYVTAKAIKVEFAQAAKSYFRGPAFIEVLERPEDESYRSVLGLWGPWAAERMASAEKPLAAEEAEGPTTLIPDAAGLEQTVEFAADEDVWRIPVKAPNNTVRVTLEGSPGFDPSITARSPDGTALEPLDVIASDFTAGTAYVFPASGGYVDVAISEQQRSTIFLFDQSASVASFIPRIRRAVVNYGNAMEKGRDAVHFKAFGVDWPREAWFTDPVPLQRSLMRYAGGGNSSAETDLLAASEKLMARTGSRAIVIITDGDADAQAKLMPTLKKARARIFVIKISSGGMFQDPTLSRPTVALWAGQTGGEVASVLQSEDIAVAYARASARLLGPKPYKISAEIEERVLKPGFLKVTSTAEQQRAQLDQMLIVFDASGSMLKRLDGSRRIIIARDALTDFIESQTFQDAANQTGLRIFGGAPGSCETKLTLPMGQNSTADLGEAIAAIRPQNNAKTAIGASLDAAVSDLANASNRSSILLVTDGEETCDGDPLEAIARLREKGIDTRIDVVSFALEPEIDRRPFAAWAEAGGGVYVDAQDAETLKEGLDKAVQQRFQVLQDGQSVASGVTGDNPMSLPPGTYEVQAEDGNTATQVTIREGETTQTAL
ncbi:MAG: VWA domain-containing protein [Pseudomonadota bacterium]